MGPGVVAVRTGQLTKYRQAIWPGQSGPLKTDAALAAAMGINRKTIQRVLSGHSAVTTNFVTRMVAPGGVFKPLEFDDLFEIISTNAANDHEFTDDDFPDEE